MDSLLANYASSDDEEQQQQTTIPFSSSAASLFSSLPNPNKSKPTSALFNSIPRPKSQSSVPISDSSVKRVVLFKPPIINPNPNNFDHGDDDDEDEKEKERKRKKDAEFASQSSNVKSFLSSIPAPKNSSFGVLGSGRKSNIGVEVAETTKVEIKNEVETDSYQNEVGYDQNYSGNVDNGNPERISQDGSCYANYSESGYNESSYDGNYGDYYSYYGQYESNNWSSDGSASAGGAAVGMPLPSEIGLGMSRKRGRNEIPAEIIEVKQDELTKNRPREDQVKMTGIAFGPSYQPASTKGKPSKLHKRKHQIGSLFFDMKQKEMELAERRSKGLLTKAQTHAKYGW